MTENQKGDAVFERDENEETDVCIPFATYESINEIGKEFTKEKNYQELFVMSLLSLIFIIAVLSSGMALGYSAILLPQLKNTTGDLYADDEMGSWIASVPSISQLFGAMAGGILMDLFGRKLTLKIQSIILALGWVCILLCQSHVLLIIGRLIGGFASAIGLTAGQIYIAEVSSPNMRGVLGSIPFASSTFGVLLVYILGSTIHWRIIAGELGIAIIPPVLVTVMYYVLPDSPDWLIRQGRIKEAREALIWLRGNDIAQVEKEMQLLINKVEYEKVNQRQSALAVWTLLGTAPLLKPLVIVILFTLLHLLAGWAILILYAVEIISYIKIDNINEFIAAVLCAGVRFTFTIIAVVVIAFIGRRPIGISTATCSAICAFSITICLYFNIGNNYFIAFCLFLYVASSTIGFTTLPTILAAELFPARTRAIAGSFIFLVGSILMFGYAKLFPFLRNLLTIEGVFLLFGISSTLASLLLYIALPETKDRSLLEIEEYFSQDNVLWITRKKESIRLDDKKQSNRHIVNI